MWNPLSDLLPSPPFFLFFDLFPPSCFKTANFFTFLSFTWHSLKHTAFNCVKYVKLLCYEKNKTHTSHIKPTSSWYIQFCTTLLPCKATGFELYANKPTYLPEVNLAIKTNRSQRVAKNARSTTCPTTYVFITSDTRLNLHLPLRH